MKRKAVWQAVKVPLKILVTGILLYLVFRKIDLVQVREVFQQSRPFFFVLAMLAFLSSQIVSSSRLRDFFKAIGLALPFWYNLKLYFLGMFYNLFLPGGIGGDAYKVYLLRARFKKPGRKLVSAILLDRLSGFWALSGIAILLSTQLPELPIPAFILASAYAIGSVVYFYLLWHFFDLSLRVIAKGHAKALAVQVLQVLSVVVLLFALNVQGQFSPYLFTFLVSSLVSLFPFTVGGLGAREYVFVLASGILPMDKHVALTLSLSFYLISVIVALSGVYFAFRSKEFALTGQESEEMKKGEALAHTQTS